MDGHKRTNIKPGTRVLIVLKQDQSTGKLTEGIVKDILTNSASHPLGIKVRLTSGAVGRVKEILELVALRRMDEVALSPKCQSGCF
jgi:uncharacterized repeat protein (TIGR03833 family)